MPHDKAMCVSTVNGDTICKSKAEIIGMIKQGAALSQGDEIWMSSSKNPYPCLSMLIKGEYACMHFFENGEGDIWQSCGDFDREVTFLAGGEAWKAPAYTVLPLEKAIDCMAEFWDTLERPQGIEWTAL